MLYLRDKGLVQDSALPSAELLSWPWQEGSVRPGSVLRASALVRSLTSRALCNAAAAAQGLTSLLWGFAKLPQPPLRTIMVIVRRVTELLEESGGNGMFDAQVCLCDAALVLLHGP